MHPRLLLLAGFLLPTTGHAADETPRTLEVVRVIPHSGYSEGLDFRNGYLWHALPKENLQIDPADGRVVARFDSASDYNESLVWVGDDLFQLSFHDDGIYKGKLSNGKLHFTRVGTAPEIHGWGIAYDGKNIVVTGNYSPKLFFLDKKSLKVIRTLETAIPDLEDLAWDGQGMWTSSFTAHQATIFRIDPKTGKTDGSFRLPDPGSCPVIDGIAQEGATLWVTGKHCPQLFQVKNPFTRSVAGQ